VTDAQITSDTAPCLTQSPRHCPNMNAIALRSVSSSCLRQTGQCHPTRLTATCSSRPLRTARCQAILKQHQQHRQSDGIDPERGISHVELLEGAGAAVRVAFVSAAAVLCLCWSPAEAEAAGRKAPPINESAGRCDVSALDKFADVSCAANAGSAA
jgi:hypothetical protein